MKQFKLENRRYITGKEHNGQTASAGQLWAGFIEQTGFEVVGEHEDTGMVSWGRDEDGVIMLTELEPRPESEADFELPFLLGQIVFIYPKEENKDAAVDIAQRLEVITDEAV